MFIDRLGVVRAILVHRHNVCAAGYNIMHKNLLGYLSVFFSTFALAQGSTFSITLGMAVLCLDDVEPGFFYNYMNKTSRPSKREKGAYWFKTSEPLFGAPVTEVFISDGSSKHTFVGVVSSLPPDQLADAIATGAPAGGNFKKVNPVDKYSTYISPAGSEIIFQGKNGKMFCRRDRIRLAD